MLKFFSVALVSFCGAAALAQPVPKLNSISPEWIQRGTTADIVVNGENLSKVTEFVFSGDEEHFRATIASESRPPARRKPATNNASSSKPANNNKQLAAKFMVSAETTLGSHEVRVIAPGGISNPLNIRVTDTPEITEAGGKHSLVNAQEIVLPVGILGKIGEADQTDFYKFSAKKNEKLIFDVQASRLGFALDSSLAILDSSGKELARNEDANGFDSFLIFEIPADGNYFVTIRDFQFRGGDAYNYHLTVGALPFVESIFPLGGQHGKITEVKLRGVNLEKETTNVSFDADGTQEIRAHTANGASNPRQFQVSAFSDFLEKEPNNSQTNAAEISVPGNINGQISTANDSDFFKFKVEKGQRFIFEIYANRFGSKLDPLLTLLNAKGEIFQRNDDAAGEDARIDQTFAEAGEYFLSIRDLLDRGGENFAYRISISSPAGPNFSAKLLSDTIRLSRGGRAAVRVEVARSDFAGAIEIVAQDLPGGISCSPLVIPADFPTGLLLFYCDKNAKLGTEPLQLNAIGVLNGKKISRNVQAISGGKPTTRNKKGRLKVVAGKSVAAAYLTVLDEAPFDVDWTTLSASVEQNQTAIVVAQVERQKNFTGDILLTVEGFAAGNDLIGKNFDVQPITLKSNGTNAKFKIKAKLDSEIGVRPIFVRADSSVNGAPLTQWSRPILFNVTEFPYVLSTSIPRIGVTVPKNGVTNSVSAEAEFSIKVQRRGLFTDDVQLALEGLPEGVTATSTNLLRGTSEAEFKLIATDKAKVSTNTLTVVGVANVNGRQFRQSAPGIQLIVNSPAEIEKTTAAK